MNDQLSFEDDRDALELRNAWDQVKKRIKAEIPSQSYERFIRPLKPCTLDGDTAIVAVPGKFVLEWVKNRHAEQLQAILCDELGRHVTLELKSELRGNPAAEMPATVAVSPKVEQSTFVPNPKFTFDNYVVGQSNRLAVAGAKAVVSSVGTRYNPLFIYGASGLGKTHLLHAIAREIMGCQPNLQLVYLTAQQFAEEFVSALQNNRIDAFRRSQRSVGVWLVDDIQFVAGKDKTQEEFFHAFNYLHALGKQIVLTSDRPPRDIYLMDERLRSRFEAGLVADVQMPNTETRCAILLSKAHQEHIALTHEVAMFLAENVAGNIRHLEGALTKLVVSASIDDSEITLPLAETMIDQYYRTGGQAKPSIDQIVSTVGKHYKITNEEIRGESRKAPIVHARHVAIYIAREVTGDSWKHIGGLFGGRDHTSMLHAYHKISEMINQDRDTRATITALMRNVRPEL
jgi:chromosomal replication initiator protein